MIGLALAGRTAVSLLVVLALMWLVARLLRGRAGGRGVGALEVVARQNLGRSAAITVVRVGERALVLGVTESQVTLLAETELAAIAEPAPLTALDPLPSAALEPVPSAVPAAVTGPLSGSILSPATWRSTVDVLREKSVRRG